jgi:hypothetical protein
LAREVKEGRFGEVIKPGDIAGLRDLLTLWKACPEKLAEMGNRARERAFLYRRDVILGLFESELSRMLGPEHPPEPVSLSREGGMS